MKAKTNIFIAFAIASIFAAASCKKNEGNPNGNNGNNGSNNTGLVKTATTITNLGGVIDSSTINYTYDAQNRVKTYILNDNGGGFFPFSDTMIYAYFTDSVVQTGSTSATYYLNSQGYEARDNAGDTWTYNAAGYLTASTSSSSTVTYTYNASNEVATKTSGLSGNVITDTYSYDSTGTVIANNGGAWNTGKASGILWTSDAQATNGGAPSTTTAVYSKDSQGRESKSVLNLGGQGTVTTYYTYY